MATSKAVLLAVLFLLLAFLIFDFIASSGREHITKPSAVSADSPSEQPAEAEQTKKVTLFFLREDDGLLIPEEREIRSEAAVTREAEETIAQLIKGSTSGLVSALPPETKLWRLFVTKEGVAYADFSKDLTVKHPSGSAAEISTVFAIVNTLTYNFKPIKKVFILIDGEEQETLGGHIRLDWAFLPNYSLVAKD
jgi:spore germination protein GerM